MKKYFPQTFPQSLLLLFISAVFGTPLVFLIQKNVMSEEIYITLNFILLFLVFLFLFYIINKKRRINLTNQFNFRIHSIILVFVLLITSFQFSLYFPIHYYFSSNITTVNSGINKFTIMNSLLFAPIFEEIIFRGVILKGYLIHYTPKKAILISSLFFGILHFNLNTPIQFIGATFSGFIFGYIYYYTKSVGMSIILHFIYNVMGLLSSRLRTSFGNSSVNYLSDLFGKYTIHLIIFSFIVFLFTIYYIYKNKEQIINKLKKLDAPRRLFT